MQYFFKLKKPDNSDSYIFSVTDLNGTKVNSVGKLTFKTTSFILINIYFTVEKIG
jgi:hypothetical protein